MYSDKLLSVFIVLSFNYRWNVIRKYGLNIFFGLIAHILSMDHGITAFGRVYTLSFPGCLRYPHLGSYFYRQIFDNRCYCRPVKF